MKRLLLVLLTMMICGCLSAQGAEQEPALTLMVYLCGSDLETSSGAATADLEEMIAHYPADGSVRVLVMASGAQVWHNGISAGETSIYELTGAGLEMVSALPLQSMGAPETLGALLDYGYAHAPAEKHALILWNHGAGPLLGLCFDEQFADGTGMDGLTLTELAGALEASPAAQEKLAWIGFDACLMASVETACTVAPYAEYMIASQDTEPASGWSYAFLTEAGHDASGAETGRRIIDAYFASLGDTLAPATLSCVDLSAMDAINAEMDVLFDGLHLTLDGGSYPDFAVCRVNTKSVGCSTAYEYDLVDMVDLLEVFQAEGLTECSGLLALLEQAIVESRSNTEYINGLNIHYPHYGSEAETPAAQSAGYAAFMADMSAIRLGEPLTDWSQRHRPEAAQADGTTLVSMPLTPEQAAHLASARLYIFKEMKGNDYQLIYQSDDVTLTEEGDLRANYEDQALFLVDGEGNVISESIPYSIMEDGLVLPCMLYMDDWETENFVIAARMIFRQDARGKYRMAEILEITDDPALQGKVTVDLDAYDYLVVRDGSICPAYDEAGRLLPPAQWPRGDLIYGWEMALADYSEWSVDFRSQQDGNRRAALLQITDTQNNVVCSELLYIENPNIDELPAARRLLMENEYCRVYFTGAQLVTGNYPQLRLLMECENLYSDMITIDANHLQLGDQVVSVYSGGSPAIEAGETKSFQIEIGQDELETIGVPHVDRIGMKLIVLRGYLEELTSQRVEFDYAMDLTNIASEPPVRQVAATAGWSGLEMTLYNLRVEGYELKGKLAIHNTNDEFLDFEDSSGVYLNDVYASGSASYGAFDIGLPAGTTIHTDVRVNLTNKALFVERPYLHGLMLEEVGVTQLERLGFTFQYDMFREDYRVDFQLQEPLELPVRTDAARKDAWHLLYDMDGVRVWLMEIVWKQDDDRRCINLCFENATVQEREFYIPLISWPENGMVIDCYVNGVELSYLYTPADIEPRCVKYETVAYYVQEEYQDLEELVLTFTMQDALGRSDKVRTVIVPLSEPQEAEGFLIYEAEQLQVTAEIVSP